MCSKVRVFGGTHYMHGYLCARVAHGGGGRWQVDVGEAETRIRGSVATHSSTQQMILERPNIAQVQERISGSTVRDLC